MIASERSRGDGGGGGCCSSRDGFWPRKVSSEIKQEKDLQLEASQGNMHNVEIDVGLLLFSVKCKTQIAH